MSGVTALCGSPQHFINNLARRFVHSRVPNLLASDYAALNRLFKCLADEILLNRTSLNKVKDGPESASKLEAVCGRDVSLRQIGIMQYEDAGNHAIAPEIRWNRHVELRRIEVRQIIKAERRVMTVYTLDFLVAVSGPQ